MKYLIKYWQMKRFTNEALDITKSDIKDCFLDLSDYGFIISVNNLSKSDSIIQVGIYKDYNRFKLSEIKETVLFAVPYLQNEHGLDFCTFNIGGMNGLAALVDDPSMDVNGNGDRQWVAFNDLDDLFECTKSVRVVELRFKNGKIS